jgi:hypothetical protein
LNLSILVFTSFVATNCLSLLQITCYEFLFSFDLFQSDKESKNNEEIDEKKMKEEMAKRDRERLRKIKQHQKQSLENLRKLQNKEIEAAQVCSLSFNNLLILYCSNFDWILCRRSRHNND